MVGVGRGVLCACFNRTPGSWPACLPLSPLVWVGRAKMKGGKVQVTHWPSQADTPRRRERQGRLGDSSERRLRAHSDSFCYYFLNSELSHLEPGCIKEAK